MKSPEPATEPYATLDETARAAVDAYVRAQCEVIRATAAPLRAGIESVHETRVAIRRLRSTLRVFGSALDPAAVAALEADLAWYGNLLGPVRDRQVLRLRMADAVAALPAELVLGPVAQHIDQRLLSEQRYHHEELNRAMQTSRYEDLLSSLDVWAARPPYAVVAEGLDRLERMATRAARKASRRLAEAPTAHDSATALHRARKAAKRARYSSELVAPLGVKKAPTRIRYFKQVQSALGDHQDSVIAAEVVRQIGAAAGTLPGHNGFTYGLLYGREIRAGEIAREEAAALAVYGY